jgi:hypothetical protein
MKVYYKSRFVGRLKGRAPDIFQGNSYHVPVRHNMDVSGTFQLHSFHQTISSVMFKVGYYVQYSYSEPGNTETRTVTPFLEWTGGSFEDLEQVIWG